MANIGTKGVTLVDQDGDSIVDATANALKVQLTGSEAIDIGDVSLLLDGTAAHYGAGNVADGGRTLRVTLAGDDPAVASLDEIEGYFKAPGHSYTAGGSPEGIISLAFRQDTIGSYFSGIGVSDDDWVYLSVNSKGGLYVTGSEVESETVQSQPLLIGGRFDSSARTIGNGEAGAIALSGAGHVLMDVVDGGQLDTIIDTLESTLTDIDADTGNIAGAIATLGTTTYSETSTKGAIIGAVRNNNLASLANSDNEITPLQVNEDGALWVAFDTTGGGTRAFNSAGASASASQTGIVSLVKMNEAADAPASHVDGEWTTLSSDLNGSLYTTHGITGGADGITTDDTNGTVLGGDVNCKKIDIQALTDNTGVIAVGFTGVDATVATGTGILLNAGDVYSLEINNLNLIYIESSINTDGVRFTYFT